MRFLARWAMRGPFHAAAIAAATMLGSLAVGVLMILSGATVALTTLRHGSREGLKIIALAATLVAVARLGLGAQPVPLLVLGVLVWLPAWLMAANLARTQRQALPLLMVAVLVAAYALAMRLAVGDVTAFWTERLEALFAQIASEGGPQLGDDQLAPVAAQVHAWTLVALFTMLAAMPLLARWWQAVLYNPGGFGAEFRELRLPRWLVPLAGACIALWVVQRSAAGEFAIAGDGVVILVVLFAFQGLAVIHHRAHALALARGWLIGLYVLLVVTPQIVGPILAATGLIDSLADFRRLGATPPRGER